jgi:hypothetical protein
VPTLPDHDVTEDPFPHWVTSVMPLVLVLSTIMLPRNVQALWDEAIGSSAGCRRTTFEPIAALYSDES